MEYTYEDGEEYGEEEEGDDDGGFKETEVLIVANYMRSS